MKISISKAIKQDTPIILELLYELERPIPLDENEINLFNDKIKEYFLDEEKSIIVAKRDSRIIGLASIIFLRRLNRTKLEMYIPELVVTEELRNFGVGKKLIQYCIDLARQKNCYRIRLESANKRKQSHKFYQNIGFEQSALSFSKNIL